MCLGVLFFHVRAYNIAMKLELSTPKFYRVKKGQSLLQIAETFRLPLRVLAACNRLSAEPQQGCVLQIPEACGNLYMVKGGETKSLLCGSVEKFYEKNCTESFYPAQIVIL